MTQYYARNISATMRHLQREIDLYFYLSSEEETFDVLELDLFMKSYSVIHEIALETFEEDSYLYDELATANKLINLLCHLAINCFEVETLRRVLVQMMYAYKCALHAQIDDNHTSYDLHLTFED